MLNYKNEIKLLICYFILSLCFLIPMNRNLLTIYIAYTDVYLFIILFFIYYFVIFKHSFSVLELTRFNRIRQYFGYKTLQFSLSNILIVMGVLIINIIIFLIKGSALKPNELCGFSINLFMLYEFVYIVYLSTLLCSNRRLAFNFFVGFYIILYLISIIGSGELFILNLFKPYIKEFAFVQSIIIYFTWFSIPLLIIYNKEDNYEL